MSAMCPGLRGNLEYNDNYMVLTSRKLFSSGTSSGFQHNVSNAVGAVGSQGQKHLIMYLEGRRLEATAEAPRGLEKVFR